MTFDSERSTVRRSPRRQPRARLARTVASAIIAAGLLASCGSSTGDLDREGSPVARYAWDASAGMAALVEGELSLSDGCLYIVAPDGATPPVVAAFPRSYAQWDAATSMLTYNGRPYEMGDAVAAGGGFVDGDSQVDGLAVPTGCDLGEWNELYLIQDTDLEP